jgi:hypothetical protein
MIQSFILVNGYLRVDLRGVSQREECQGGGFIAAARLNARRHRAVWLGGSQEFLKVSGAQFAI